MTDQVTIERLGHAGDGIAGAQFYPFTLPGETILPADGGVSKILTPSPDRVAPPCPHFGRCGGCSLQHASDRYLADWKQDIVRRALAARGLQAPIQGIETSPPHSRRRATFAVKRTKKGIQFGFHGRASDQIVDITHCDLLRTGMLDLREVCAGLARAGASRKGVMRVQVTESLEGWDVAVTDGKPLDGPMRVALAQVAASANLARLAWDGEPVATARPPGQRMGRATVVPPAGAFLQATQEGAAALVAAVREAVGDAARVADLFAGCGTFALPLSERAEVHAVEGDAGMMAALDRGWREATGLKQVTTEVRDLFRRPLEPIELKSHDAVVIDPPRAGAEAQTDRLAASAVPRIAAVSCNPVTFARDAQVLVAAGYALDWIRVVDQFRWSGHVELAACFSRTASGRG